LSYIGIDPRKDINWLMRPLDTEVRSLFFEGKADAFLAFPPVPQELRAKKIGRVILNSTIDRPWSQYVCCMLAGNREFVRKYPVATKRVLRAHEVGLIKNTPQKIIAQGTDWRFLNELKRELKA
jgi:NitT/TauT family transport system substrate-binding protein